MYLYERIAEEKKRQEEKIRMYENIPKEPEEKRYVSLMGSMSHTYGNALAFMQNWIIKLFPENMFKTIHVNSKIAHRQLRSTPHEFLKKNKPMIIFRPRISTHDEDRFLQGTALTERQTDLYNTWGNGTLQPFFHDPNNDLSIKYLMNRSVMYMDVIITLSTLMQQLDYYHYIENAIRINHPFNINTCFESYIPQEMLKIVSDCTGVPLYDEHGNTKEFLTYMNQNSSYPITYKLQGSSKTREFYRYYPVTIDTIITDLDKDDGDRTGNVMSNYQISFTVKMEFFSTGFYYIFSDKIFDINLPKIELSDSAIIPVFTDVLLKEDLNLPLGWHLYNRASCRLESEDDIINIDQMLNDSIREAIKYHKENGIPIFDFIDVKIRRQGVMIHYNKDYTIDWDTLDVKFKQQDTYHTYSIMVCLNIEYINDLMKKIFDLK